MARTRNIGYMNAFSKHFRKLRKESNLTLQRAGENAGLDLATIERIEKTGGNVTISTVLALAKALGKDPKELLDFPYHEFL